jgi:hypothetical protein
MTENELVFRPPIHSDLPAMAALLTAEGFGDDNADRLRTAFDRLQTFSLVALQPNRLAECCWPRSTAGMSLRATLW